MRARVTGLLVAGAAGVLLAVAALGAIGRWAPRPGGEEPLLVPLQLSLPVELGSAGAVHTATVALALQLEISLADGSAPTVRVDRATGSFVAGSIVTGSIVTGAVSTGPTGAALFLDNRGLPHAVETTPGLAVGQVRSGADATGAFELLVEVRNQRASAVSGFNVRSALTLFDETGTLLELADGYLLLHTLQPGQTSTMRFITRQPLGAVDHYRLQLALDE